MNKQKEKKFDSVRMMRDIREKLSKKYSQNPNQETDDLAKIKAKYKIKSKEKVAS
jgi:hypothetical protein